MSESEAKILIEKAEKKAQPTAGFMKWLSGGDGYRLEEAAELYVEAGNLYRLSKQLEKAGDTFIRAAQCQIDANNEDEAGNMFVEAFKCYKKSNPASACKSLDKAVDIFTRKGQFRRGAYFKYELAEIQEMDLQDYQSATNNYETAGDWYLQDQAVALSNKAFLKCADLLTLDHQHLRAAELYQKVIANSLGNRLSQWALKDYYLKVALCYLAAGDTVAAQKTVSDAKQEDPSFGASHENDFLVQIVEDVKQSDVEGFTAHVTEFDKFNKLDKWKTSVLLQIKESLAEAEDDLL
ncbi:HDL330Wp [Eremothecium sinecaudum]|uniref:HDL330Wp n=1 Tax=Eremothecium sinecaudum TaxID=45286 RepID=A0A0X8HS17_9SACH|nr:HDL330Wp [Eremothecium sinecaudum]AMD20414.1 HDL330Wp [Eremothecium sinecaudum]